MSRPNEFSRTTEKEALERRKNRCGSCGTYIAALGSAGRSEHEYGEGAQAHHMRHVKFGGSSSVNNCVILCDSCHHSAHEGGNYRFGKEVGGEGDFPYFRRSRR